MKPAELFSILSESAAAFWNARNERERSILLIGSTAVVLFLIYAIFFGPALSGRATLTKSMPAMRQQLAEIQALAKQAGELAGATAPDPEPVSQDAITASLSSHGMKPQNLSVTSDLVRVQLNPVAFSSLLDWVAEQQKNMRLTVVDANFIALPQTDMVNATVTLRQQKSGE